MPIEVVGAPADREAENRAKHQIPAAVKTDRKPQLAGTAICEREQQARQEDVRRRERVAVKRTAVKATNIADDDRMPIAAP